MSESNLSADIRKALTLAGLWVIRLNSGSSRVRGGYIHGAPVGTPDLLIVAPVYGWLEVKMPGKYPTAEQRAWHDRAEKEKVRVATVRSVEDALRTVQDWKNHD